MLAVLKRRRFRIQEIALYQITRKARCSVKAPQREYGFTDALISRLVIRWPNVLLVRYPNKTLLPKLEFLRSIGVPLPVLAQKLSICPFVL
ncbi:hypothetical protein PHJA_002903200 [Phtheirospermum japonicum]|uniref:Uncharacterized protein n=1 Tax=Phtheirospermum japonicum TaxID=374723 RepID=A0A830D664_9LAMI|nr:hypothetical protein PHJA_002903200 [Phtheirospermum japonicum]